MRLDINDFDRVYRVMSELWEYNADDGTTTDIHAVVMGVLNNRDFYVLSPHEDMVFLLHPHNSYTYRGHVSILRESRRISVSAGREVLEYMFTQTPCRKIIVFAPTSNPAAAYLAAEIGMAREGVVTQSWLKDGKMYDEIIYGIGVEKWAGRA